MKLLKRLRPRWDNNIKMDIRKTSWEDVNCTELAQDRVQIWTSANSTMNLKLSYKRKFNEQLNKCLLLKKRSVPGIYLI
jgi:hypothetical protein